MKAVILDGYRFNPGDMKWKGFTDLCDCDLYEFTPPEETISRSKDAEILITNKTAIYADVIKALPHLKYIGVLATGYNVVDIEEAKKRGIVVTNIPAYSTQSVTEMVFAHLLNITLQVGYHSGEVKAGRWSRNRDFSFWDTPLLEIDSMTMGIVSLGNIGCAVAHVAMAFGMKVIAFTSKKQEELPEGIKKVDLETLFKESDVISLHCPLTKDTTKLVNEERLAWMKPTAILINTSRGGVIDEYALANALNNGKIYAAGVDVLSEEPPQESNPLLTAKNCFITPHYAWATRSARRRLMDIAVSNLKSFIEGNPINNIAK